MDDYISRQSAIAETLQDGAYGYISTAELERLPAADVQPVRHGHWILQTDKSKKLYGWHLCSECGAYIGEPTNYCSNCGTHMEGSEE